MPPDPLLEDSTESPNAAEADPVKDELSDESTDEVDVEAAYRLENARLRTRVDELERELAERDRARRVLVEQYERILDDRENEASRSEPASLLARIRRFVGFDG